MVTATAPRRTPFAVLLHRRGVVYLAPTGPEASTPTDVPDPLVVAGVTLLEADLIERGLLMSEPLRRRLEHTDPATLANLGVRLLADLDAALGADRTWTPLFRGFPESTPDDTLGLWVDRVLTVLLQEPEQPCVLCGLYDTVAPLSPCGHLVCDNCFDGSEYSACPICYRALDRDEPFLLPRPGADEVTQRVAGGGRLRLIGLGDDILTDAHAEVATLLTRPAALSPDDRDDLLALLPTHDRTALAWLPEVIPGRETNAVVLDWLLRAPEHWPVTLPAVAHHLRTATDVLRLLTVRSGGDAGLTRRTPLTAVPRPVRHLALAALNRLPAPTLIEDLRRHEFRWLRAAQRLHPFEHAQRYPVAAAGFAALRGTELTDPRLAAQVARAGLSIVDGRVAARGFNSRVELLLDQRDGAGAVDALATRPGELVRRLGAVLTRDPSAAPALLNALPAAARAVAPAVLLSALGALRLRADIAGGHPRVVFPKGVDAKAHVLVESRPPLAGWAVDAATGVLVDELLARCAALPPVAVAVFDQRLADLTAPFTQRSTSRALVTLPRGSRLSVAPDVARLRLFLHWTQPARRRVDLDLSVAFFDLAWNHLGTCDYTSLRWRGHAAVHSGDRTDAPAPDGASEFVDLDLDALSRTRARFAVVSVFSFNNVAFEQLTGAFAGVQVLGESTMDGAVFDPRAVRQRFDLAGRARAVVPFVLDLADASLRWLDVARGVTGSDHAVHRHRDELALLGWAMTGYYASPARVRLGEVALWHCAARARTVLRLDPSGELTAYARGAHEAVADFAARIADGVDPGPWPVELAGLAFLAEGDPSVGLAPGAQVYALDRGDLDPGAVELLTADDLVASLHPTAPVVAASTPSDSPSEAPSERNVRIGPL